jgi:hypothetical protein
MDNGSSAPEGGFVQGTPQSACGGLMSTPRGLETMDVHVGTMEKGKQEKPNFIQRRSK